MKIENPEMRVSGINPTRGHVGDTVRISGVHFGTVPGMVVFAGIGHPAAILSWTDEDITTRVPQGTVNGNVEVHAAGQVSAAVFELL